MITKIDWLSFTFPCYLPDNLDRDNVIKHINAYAREAFEAEIFNTDDLSKWENGKGRAPFSNSFRNAERFQTVFYGSGTKVALVEISGQGVEQLVTSGAFSDLLKVVRHRVTRIDLACDILTSTAPDYFCRAGYSPRFKSHSEFVSDSGSTFYVGSRDSDRYARVYRWNEPHERSAFLRVEYVFKAEEAKAVAQALLINSVQEIAASAGDAFGWKHWAWKVDAPSEADIKAFRPERHEGKTLFWLNDTIAPLLARLHNEGIIDVYAWFDENVKPFLKTGDLD